MTRYIISTSINEPTEAILAFDEMKDWTLIVVGDYKTPGDYKLKHGIYLSPADQENMDKELSDLIGWNCIQRRNFGFLHAFQLGADVVATVDDDNIPLLNWGKNLLIEDESQVPRVECYWHTDEPCYDPMTAARCPKLWHRGFPLSMLSKRQLTPFHPGVAICPSIQADFWEDEPDVDAICRLEHNPHDVQFDTNAFPFAGCCPSPFNSQNTFLLSAVLPHYFMFPGIGRMDDIWASYHVQALGFKVVYNRPSVRQVRNAHNILEDMKAEYLGYEQNGFIVEEMFADKRAVLKRLPERSLAAFERYQSLMGIEKL